MNVQIYASRNELAPAAANYFVARSVEHEDRFTVAISGGSTPKLMYELLADEFRNQVPWGNVHFFWSDERHVPPDHPESNYRMAYQAMLSRVPLLEGNVHRMNGEMASAQEAADQYEERVLGFTASNN